MKTEMMDNMVRNEQNADYNHSQSIFAFLSEMINASQNFN